MKNTYYRRLLFGLFLFALLLGIGLLSGSNPVQAKVASLQSIANCPLHTVGLSHSTYSPANKAEVIELQKILSQDSDIWPAKYKINGVFDWGTVGSVYRFQRKYGLSMNGTLDKPTLDKLCEFWKKMQVLKQSGEKEDVVSGTLSASAISVKLGRPVTLTITAHDKQGVDKVFLFYQGNWHSKSCNRNTTCTRTFTVKENKPGMYLYYGYVSGYKLNGTKEGASTQPSFRRVNVIGRRNILYPLNGNGEEGQGSTVSKLSYGEKETVVNKENWTRAPGFNFSTIASTKQNPIELPLQTKWNLGNSAIPPITRNASLSHPVLNVTKDAKGKYNIKWITLNDTPVQAVITDEKGKIVAQGSGKFISTLFHIPLKNGQYTLSVVKNGTVLGKVNFDTNLIEHGGQIIHNSTLWQYDTKGSQFMNYITAALSPDKKTLNLDYQLNRNQGVGKVVITYPDGSQKILTNNLKSWGTMIEGKKLSLQIDTAKLQNGKCKIDVYDNNGHQIEEYAVNAKKGIPEVASTFRGATGEGSVYDPITWQSGTVSGGRNTNQFNWKAKGASMVKLIDSATGKVIRTSGGGGMTVSGLEKGHTYYLVFYDHLGNVANTQVFSVNKKGLANSPHQLSNVTVSYMGCGGGTYQLGFPGDWENNLQITKVTDSQGNQIKLTGYRNIPKKFVQPGTKFIVTYKDKKTGAVYKETITVGSKQNPSGGYAMTYSELECVNGPFTPQYKATSTAVSNGGQTITTFSNGYEVYAKVNVPGLKLVPPSQYHGRLSRDKYIEIYNNYLKTGTLPHGDWEFVDSKGRLALRTYVFQDGRVKNLYDKTKAVKSEKDIQQGLTQFFIGEGNNKGNWLTDTVTHALNDPYAKKHTVSLTKMIHGVPYTVTVNPTKDTVTVKIGSSSKTFSNIEEVKKYLKNLSKKASEITNKEKKPEEETQTEVKKPKSKYFYNPATGKYEKILYRRPPANLAANPGSFWHNFMASIFGLWSKVTPQNK